MAQINNITIEGRAGKDGKRVSDKLAVFSIAYNDYKRKPNPASDKFEDRYDVITRWFNVRWYDTPGADNRALSVIKGKQYEVSGRLAWNEYNGQTQLEIIADHIKELAPKTPQQERPRQAVAPMPEMMDEEIPF